MDSEFKRVVEVNGVKIEVDLRTAKRVDQFKVGDSVKVLIKEYSNYRSYVGCIVGFDEFKNLPTISVAYVVYDYASTAVKFVGINAETKDYEIAPLQDHEKSFDFNRALNAFDTDINKKKREVEDAETRKEFFIKNYDLYFSQILSKNSED